MRNENELMRKTPGGDRSLHSASAGRSARRVSTLRLSAADFVPVCDKNKRAKRVSECKLRKESESP